jgi:hypothetical protein
MKFSLRYGLSPQDMFLLLTILKRLARKRRRFDANMKKRKILSVLKSALQFERAKDVIRERNYLIAASLMPAVSGTPWYHIYSYANDPSLINVISLPRFAFEDLLKEFSKHYVVNSGTIRGGRPPRVKDKHAILSIILHYYTGTME